MTATITRLRPTDDPVAGLRRYLADLEAMAPEDRPCSITLAPSYGPPAHFGPDRPGFEPAETAVYNCQVAIQRIVQWGIASEAEDE